MLARAARIHGRDKIAVSEIELPEIGPDELLLRVISSSMCLSTYKALSLGESHKRVPDDVSANPAITGHEFAGVLEEVGTALADSFTPGQRVAILPTMGLPSGYSPGYSYPFFGGDSTYCIIPKIAIDKGCVLPYDDTYYANASLAEPMSCIIGAFHASYHTVPLVWKHDMGIRKGGTLALLGCGGAMGVGALDYALHGPYRSKTVVAVDVSAERLDRLERLFPKAAAAERGIDVHFVDASQVDVVPALRELTDGRGFDDVIVFAAHRGLVEDADALLGEDGCLNFFAGPTDKNFTAGLNLYNVHYESTHIVGTSGGSRRDMEESLQMSAHGHLNPSKMVTHIGGVDAVPDALRGLPDFPGGKILIYPQADLDLVAIEEFDHLGRSDPRFAELSRLTTQSDGIWNDKAETYLLAHFV